MTVTTFILPCSSFQGLASAIPPSCMSAGGNEGTHFTHIESYTRFLFDPSADLWTVWSGDGTRTILAPIHKIYGDTLTVEWAPREEIDTLGNTIHYDWIQKTSNGLKGAVLSKVRYANHEVLFHYVENHAGQSPPSTTTRATADPLSPISQAWAISLIHVKRNGKTFRVYKLGYERSEISYKSRLSTIRTYGNDADVQEVAPGRWEVTNAPSAPCFHDPLLMAPPKAPLPNEATPLPCILLSYQDETTNSSYSAAHSTGLLESQFRSEDVRVEDLFPVVGNFQYPEIVVGMNGLSSRLPNGFQSIYFALPEKPAFQGKLLASHGGTISNATAQWMSDALALPGGRKGDLDLLTTDVNGDGKTDLVAVRCSRAGAPIGSPLEKQISVTTDISSNTGFEQALMSSLPGQASDCDRQNSKILAGDFNGDGLGDLLVLKLGSSWAANNKVEVYLGNGNSFLPTRFDGDLNAVVGAHVPYHYLSANTFVVDVNGDGMSDVVTYAPWANGPFQSQVHFMISDGSNFKSSFAASNTVQKIHADQLDQRFYRAVPGDFNGDGVTDIMHYSTRWDEARLDFLGQDQSQGSGRVHGITVQSQATSEMYLKGGQISDYLISPLDENGDGKTDVSITRLAFHSMFDYWHDKGVIESNFSRISDSSAQMTSLRKETFDFFGGNPSDYVSLSLDTNGDMRFESFFLGLMPMNQLPPSQQPGTQKQAAFSAGALFHSPTDFLTYHQNGYGATEWVDYGITYSAFATRAGQQIAIPVVEKIRTDIGREAHAKSPKRTAIEYEYENAVYDQTRGAFGGFQKVTSKPECDSNTPFCPQTVAHYKIDPGFPAVEEEVVTTFGAGVTQKMKRDLLILSSSPPLRMVTAAETTTVMHGSSCAAGSCQIIRVDKTYDKFGNVTSEVVTDQSPGIAPEVLRQVRHESYANMKKFILHKPALSMTFAPDGSISQGIATLYDGRGLGDYNKAPLVGLPTSTVSHLDYQIVPKATFPFYDINAEVFVRTFTEYDSFGNITKLTDADGVTTVTTYDPVDNITPIETYTMDEASYSPNGASGDIQAFRATSVPDDNCDAVKERTTANGVTYRFQYDALCRTKSRSWNPDGGSNSSGTVAEIYEYSTDHRMSTVTTRSPYKLHGRKRVYLDGLGRTYKTETGVGASSSINDYVDYRVTWSLPDRFGRPGAISSEPYLLSDAGPGAFPAPNGTVEVRFNDLGQVIERISQYGSMRVEYGPREKRTITDSGDYVLEKLDRDGRVILREEGSLDSTGAYIPLNTQTHEYDFRGKRIKTTDNDGAVWQARYNNLGHKLYSIHPDNGLSILGHTVGGTQTLYIDSAGGRRVNEFDRLNRLQTETTYSPNNVETERTEYRYQPNGLCQIQNNCGYRLAGYIDNHGSLQYSYAPDGRILSSTRTIDGNSFTFNYSYDAAGNPTGVQYPDGEWVGGPNAPYQYNAAGELKAVPGYISDVQYDASGRVTQISFANGVVTDYDIDTTLNGLQTRGPQGQLYQDYEYIRRNDGRIHTLENRLTGVLTQYGYSNRQLVEIDDGAALYKTQFTPGGKIQSADFLTSSEVFEYNDPQHPHAVTRVGNRNYQYGKKGNMIDRNGQSIRYNFDNKPVQFQRPGAPSINIRYDGPGSKLVKEKGAERTYYLGENFELKGNQAIKWINIGGRLVAARSGLFTNPSAASTVFVHSDHSGAVNAITDEVGALVWEKLLHDPWNIFQSATAAPISRIMSGGAQYDEDLKLIDYGVRWFDPEIRQFLSVDPAPKALMNVAIQPYGASNNDPVNNGEDGFGFIDKALDSFRRLMDKNLGKSIRFWEKANIPLVSEFSINLYKSGAYIMELSLTGGRGRNSSWHTMGSRGAANAFIAVVSAIYSGGAHAMEGAFVYGFVHGSVRGVVNGNNLEDSLRIGIQNGVNGVVMNVAYTWLSGVVNAITGSAAPAEGAAPEYGEGDYTVEVSAGIIDREELPGALQRSFDHYSLTVSGPGMEETVLNMVSDGPRFPVKITSEVSPATVVATFKMNASQAAKVIARYKSFAGTPYAMGFSNRMVNSALKAAGFNLSNIAGVGGIARQVGANSGGWGIVFGLNEYFPMTPPGRIHFAGAGPLGY